MRKSPQNLVFFGDSIVTQGFSASGFIQHLKAKLTSFHFINRGINGNRVWQMLQRFDQDVKTAQPDKLVLIAGTNDVWYHSKGQGTQLKDFKQSYHQLLQNCLECDICPILVTPHLIGELPHGNNEFDTMLDQFVEVIQELAQQYALPCIDTRTAFQAQLSNTGAKQCWGHLTTDGVHLNDAGQQLYAALLYPALAPSDASL